MTYYVTRTKINTTINIKTQNQPPTFRGVCHGDAPTSASRPKAFAAKETNKRARELVLCEPKITVNTHKTKQIISINYPPIASSQKLTKTQGILSASFILLRWIFNSQWCQRSIETCALMNPKDSGISFSICFKFKKKVERLLSMLPTSQLRHYMKWG